MKLQAKLTGAFGVVAAAMFAVSLLACWEVHRLGMALYEVGVVRLPSIQGLVMMSDAMSELGDSAQSLLASAEPGHIGREPDRQARAWRRFDEGWSLYEPLPRTADESELWRAFVPTAKAWRGEYAGILSEISVAQAAHDSRGLADARRRLEAANRGAYARTAGLLGAITALNYRVADDAKRNTVSSYRDMRRVNRLMLLAAVASLFGAMIIGVVGGHRLSRPVVEMADALSAVADGNLTVQGPVSGDEIGRMAGSLNRMVEALRASDSRLRLLGDNLPDCMVYQLIREADGTGRFAYMSAGVERIHGISVAEVLRDSSFIYRMILEEDRPGFEAARLAANASMTVFRHQYRVRLPDGSLRWMSLCSRPRPDSGGRVIWDGIVMDVTERVLKDASLRDLNSRLEHRVAERTAELETKNKDLETFAYSVSHDLKAPLRGIEGYSKLLLLDHAAQLDDEGRQFLYNIRHAAEQMDLLIHDLLEYSNIDRRAVEHKTFDLRALVATLVHSVAPQIADRGGTLAIELSCGTVYGDPQGYAQALRNLIDNAVKFTQHSPVPRVEIGSRNSGNGCLAWVRDNGAGFDMKYHDRIFEIFQRLHRAEEYPGTGVGLAIVRRAMQRMRGRVWAESEPGKGAVFYLETPGAQTL